MVQWKTFSFTYGTVEFRAKMAGGQGPWAAVWLLGADCQASNVTSADNIGACSWPNPGSDEVDIAETLFSDHFHVNQQLHAAGNDDGCSPESSDVSQNYQLIWGPGSLTWTIDGNTTCEVKNAKVPSRPMFLLINTALGGVGGDITNSTLPQTMVVDYVKVTR
jgi:beta-glucanase (GH16 family)